MRSGNTSRWLLLLAAVAVAPLCVLHCAYGATITGTVSNITTGIPIGGAVVTLDGAQPQTTGIDGLYTFEGVALGTHRVMAAADNYYAQAKTVKLTAEGAVVANLQLAPLPPPSQTVTDTFSRTSLGTTEDSNHFPWILGAGETMASVDQQLDLGEMSPLNWCSGVGIGGGFLPADVDVTVSFTRTPGGNPWAGVGYRMAAAGGGFSGPGYIVGIQGDMAWIWSASLNWRVTATLAPIDWSSMHVLRVKAIGSHHEAWFDDTKVVDFYDSATMSGGYVSLLRGAGAAQFDDLSINAYAAPGTTITGRVFDAAAPSVGIADASITADTGEKTTTDSSGNYTLPCRVLTASLLVGAESYYGAVVDVAPVAGQVVRVDVGLDALPASGPEDHVFDTFTRTDPSGPGSTEDPNRLPWIIGPGETLGVWTNGTQLEMPTDGGTLPNNCGVSIGGEYQPADLDATTTFVLNSDPTWPAYHWAGIGYRYDAPGTFVMSTAPLRGYTVGVQMDGTYWMYGGNGFQCAGTLSPLPDWSAPHTLRVKAAGPFHTAWFDGTKIIETYDATKLASGYVGLLRAGGLNLFEDFDCKRYVLLGNGSISGVVSRVENASATISGAKVLLNTGAYTFSDADGRYSFTRLPMGTYEVTASADGFYTKTYRSIVLTDEHPDAVQNCKLMGEGLPSPPIYDTFTRASGSDLGTTEDALHLPWVRSADDEGPAIASGRLELTPYSPARGLSIDNYTVADLDASVDMSFSYASGFWGGFAYRQDSVCDLNAGGYVVECPTDGASVVLIRAGAKVASSPVSPALDWTMVHTLRVRAVGSRHQVWIDGVNYLDVTDQGKTTAGYVGLFRDLSDVWADNFMLTSYDNKPQWTITGTVTETGNPSKKIVGAEVQMNSGVVATTDANGVYTATISASAPATSMVVLGPGYASKTVTIDIQDPVPGNSYTVDASLTPLQSSATAYDTFSRPDSSSLGTTEDANHYPWVSPTAPLSILGGQLSVPDSAGNSAVCLADGAYQPTDLDAVVSFSMTQGSGPALPWAGIGYRSSVQSGIFAGTGYAVAVQWSMVWIWSQALGWHVTATLSPVPDWSVPHTLRVRAFGSHHEAWFDGRKVVDLYDTGTLGAGYVNLVGGYGPIQFDNFAVARGGLLPVQTVPSVGAISGKGDGSIISVAAPIVTAVFPGCFYVEDANRASGIRVISGNSVSRGDAVRVMGTLATVGGERQINAYLVEPAGSGSVAPLGTTGRSLGQASGLPNTGLLVTIWGNVTGLSEDSTTCYVDDGSGKTTDGFAGIRVILAGTIIPAEGDYVSCTGISRMIGGTPALQMRADGDLVVWPK